MFDEESNEYVKLINLYDTENYSLYIRSVGEGFMDVAVFDFTDADKL